MKGPKLAKQQHSCMRSSVNLDWVPLCASSPRLSPTQLETLSPMENKLQIDEASI